VILNDHIYHNLLKWNILQRRRAAIVSLYNPQLSEIACDFHNRVRLIPPEQVLDGVAIMINRYAARLFLSKQNRPGDLNAQFIQIARKLKRPVYCHAPSLAQRGLPENGNPLNQAADFDPQWRT
jgi:hypothetical protein